MTTRVRDYGLAVGVGGLLGVGALFGRGSGPPVDVGTLAPVEVPPAERVVVERLGRGETIGALLERVDLAPEEQYSLLLAFREQASPRRLRAGTEVTLRRLRDGRALRGVDVALNPDETVRLSRGPLGWSSTRIQTPVWTDTIYATGTIENVLWNAVVGNPGLDHLPARDRNLLIHQLDQVFQWQVDFSRQIRKGDAYRFAFERQVRPDGSMRSGHVVAAELVNQGRSFYAVWFDPHRDGKGGYYDLEGESVRRAFLKKPLEFRRISSRFSGSRFHPVQKVWKAHRGVDYAADSGTPIQATGAGVVSRRGWYGNCGNMVEIAHANGFKTKYCHLRGFASGIVVGSRLAQAQVVGYVGMTGSATGPHLHYEMIRNGRHVDPLAVELPADGPVPPEAWERWEQKLPSALALLNHFTDPMLQESIASTPVADESD